MEQKQKDLKNDKILKNKNPNLANEWHPTKNGNKTPDQVLASSREKVWWLGACGHEWLATIGSRDRGSGCPFCSNKAVLLGFNDLATINPELMDEWDYDKNTSLKPTEITAGSGKRAWWKCSLGHSYDMSIALRTGKQKCGCPYCSIPAKKVLKGFNDLEFKFPDIAAQWDIDKNGNLKPDQVLCGTEKSVWWICSKGHSYKMPICTRTGKAKGNCPYCSNQKLLKGYNDFETKHPEMLAEWDYDKNSFLPSEIGVGTRHKVWWICPFGHSYSTQPSNRVGKFRTGCPICAKEDHTSFPEQALFYYIKHYFTDSINADTKTLGLELDIYIPSIKTAIEYDGLNWHRNNQNELRKNDLCKMADIKLIRIREKGLDIYNDCVCIVREDPRSDDDLNMVINKVLSVLEIESMEIDVKRDSMKIYGQYVVNRKLGSLESEYPSIAAEWHYGKNGDIKPNMVSYGSNKTVWWNCLYGHEYQMSISDRTNQNCGCPYCSGKRVLKGYNDLQTKYPELMKEWDFEKNSLTPDSVQPHSDKKAWWICKKCGNSWRAKIDSRTRMKAGCPACGQKVINQVHYKPIRNIETGVVYESIQQASKVTGINSTCIGNVCRGKQRTAGKYHWEFV